MNERLELPQNLWHGHTKKIKHLYIYTITNGYSKILVFADMSKEAII
jgi:hypothetical protein